MAKISSFCPGGICANSYLITDEASGLSALVDCGEDSPAMRSFIGGAKLEYILLTHGHFDHIGGAAAIKSEYGARLAVSRQDEPMLSSGKLNLSAFMGGIVPKVTADIIVEEGSVITLGSTEIKVLATPGHTPGGVTLVCGDAIFSGDTLFRGSCGRTDFPGGDMKLELQSLKRIAALEGDYDVYPGHDLSTRLSIERAYNPYMRHAIEHL